MIITVNMNRPFLSYGNFCGPGWSDGKRQNSVVGKLEAIDAFDETCKEHDAQYAVGGNLKDADYKFFNDNFLKGVTRTGAAIGVGIQGLFRGVDNNKSINMTKKNINQVKPGMTSGLSTKQFNALQNELRQKRNNKGGGATPRGQRLPPVNKSLMTGVSAPASKSYSTSAGKPRFASKGGNCTITHREYVGIVSNSTGFSCSGLECNPGSTITFPWLSSMANNYDRYRWRKLGFSYVPSVSSATNGRLTLAFNYNALDSPPASKSQIFSIDPNTEVSCWNGTALDIPCRGNELYVRSGLPPSGDLKTYDMGNLLVATDLGSNTNTIGELYVDYIVELICPHPAVPFFTSITTTSSTAANMLPTTSVQTGNSQVTNSPIANSIQFNESGRYFITAIIGGTVLTNFTGGMGANGTFAGAPGFVHNGVTINSGATAGCYTYGVDVVVSPTLKIATWLFTPTATTITNLSVVVSRMDQNISYPI